VLAGTCNACGGSSRTSRTASSTFFVCASPSLEIARGLVSNTANSAAFCGSGVPISWLFPWVVASSSFADVFDTVLPAVGGAVSSCISDSHLGVVVFALSDSVAEFPAGLDSLAGAAAGSGAVSGGELVAGAVASEFCALPLISPFSPRLRASFACNSVADVGEILVSADCFGGSFLGRTAGASVCTVT
jgi:hypothetical protein